MTTFVDLPGPGRLYLGDCVEAMREVPDGVVDMVLCDLPYGTTNNKWDAVIPFEPLWAEYWRVCKSNAAVVLTAAQPFTSALIMSQPKAFRYALVWDKKGTTGFQLAKRQPLRRHEDVLLFYRKQPTYNPAMEQRGKPRNKGGSKRDNGCYGELRSTASHNDLYYPTSILAFSNAAKGGDKFHPTEKPVPLFEYLVRTYTDRDQLVLDCCMGSGTTAVACLNAGRRWVGVERDEGYHAKAVERIRTHVVPSA